MVDGSGVSVDCETRKKNSGNSYRVSLRDLLVLVVLANLVHLSLLNNWFVANDFSWLEVAKTTPPNFLNLLTLQSSNFFRPIIFMVFLLEWKLFGLWAPGYYLLNLVIFSICIILFYSFILRLVRDRRMAFLAGLLFSINFCHHEAIQWISGIPSLLAGLWFLATGHLFLSYLEKGSGKYLLLCALAFCGGLLTEETTVNIPLVLLILAIATGRREGIPRWLCFCVVTFPLFVAFLGFQYYVHRNIGLVAIGHFRLIGWHTLRLFILGLFQLVIPLPNYLIRRLFLDWGFERNELIAYLKIIGPFVAMGLFIGLIFIRTRLRRRNFRLSRIEKTGIVWAAASLLPFCFFPQELFPASRYLFIPAMGWAVLLASISLYLLDQMRRPRRLIGILVLWLMLHTFLIWRMERDYAERGEELFQAIPALTALDDSIASLQIFSDHPILQPHFSSFTKLWMGKEFKQLAIRRIERKSQLEAALANDYPGTHQAILVLWKGKAEIHFSSQSLISSMPCEDSG